MSKHPAAEHLQRTLEQNLPSTDKISTTLEKSKEAIDAEAAKQGMFSGTRQTAKDTSTLLQTTKEFIEEKNQGELVQKIIKDSAQAVSELAKIMKTVPMFQDRNRLLQARYKAMGQVKDFTQMAQDNLESMKTLVLTLVNSHQFRALLSECSELIQETFRSETQGAPEMKLNLDPYTNKPLTDEAKEKANQVLQFGKQVVTDVKQGNIGIPEDKKQLIQYRFKNLINNLNSDPNFRKAIDGFFGLMDQIQYYATQLKEQTKGQLQEKAQQFNFRDSALMQVFNDTKIFIAGFTGEDSLNRLVDDSWNLMNLILNDEQLRVFFWEFRQYVSEVLYNPALLEEPTYKTRWDNLVTRAKQHTTNQQFRDLFYANWADLETCMDNIKHDTLTQRLANDAARVAKDLFLDTSGKPSFTVMAQGLVNLRDLLLPVIRKNLENVYIPGFTGSNEKYDWNIDGMYLNAAQLLPDNIEVKTWGRAQISLTDKPSEVLDYMTMWIRNIGIEAKNLKFHFVRKSTPKLDERGIAYIFVSGRNEIKVTWRVQAKEGQPWVFSIEQVHVDLGDLDVTIKESTHKFMMKMVTSLFAGTIQRSIEDALEKNIRESLGMVNHKMSEAVAGMITM